MARTNDRDPRRQGDRRYRGDRPQQQQQYRGEQRYQGERRRVYSDDPRYREPVRRREAPVEETGYEVASTLKGIIAVFITILIVVVIIMLFARSLFVTNAEINKNVKTGHLTETAYVSVDPNATLPNQEEVVATETTKKKKKKSTTTEASVALPEGLDTSNAGDYIVNDAVYLHPEPSSSSAELVTLNKGDEVKVYGNSNYGWYYLEYKGQMGYAWGTYFTPKS
ncbi:MAG: SH3 domain-containing protein [Ruminococcus sp.]|nr:SH3 domain-containing protein [Ruminococcus sp.]